jgi:hypothetical protein
MKRFICLHLIPATLLNNAVEFLNVAIPVDRICEVTDHIDTTIYKGTIQSKILMDDGMVYYSTVKTQEICNMLN